MGMSNFAKKFMSLRGWTMKNKDFVAFILSHGRAEKVDTYKTLKKQGYTGEIIFICDDDDKQLELYKKKYKNVEVFNKKDVEQRYDTADNFENRGCIFYARNYCFEIAKKLGIKNFIELDDDYTSFSYLYDKNGNYKRAKIKNLDNIFDAYVDFLNNTPVDCVAMIQGGDLIGGKDNSMIRNRHKKRKCMNTFFCSTEKPFEFYGKINEDVNTYTYLGSIGKIFFQLPEILMIQKQTQSNSGGMTEQYLDSGTYYKTFYSIMYMPSAVQIYTMGDSNKRIHHFVNWKYCVPCILDEKYKKAG